MSGPALPAGPHALLMELSMVRTPGRLALALISASGLASPALAQFRVCAWNISGYTTGTSRDAAFKTAIYGAFQGRSLAPDVMIVQEIAGNSTTGLANAQGFLGVLNTAP